MPERDTAPLGAPCWVQLTTSAPDVSRHFYRELFGWDAGEPSEELGGYFVFTLDSVPVAGGMPAMGDAVPDVWSVYLATDDVRKTVDVATESGAHVVVPPMPVADLGTMAFVVDPGGAGIGAWQAEQFEGIGVLGENGAPSWFELHTRHYDRTVEFYRQVFRWDAQPMSDVPEFRYTVLRSGEEMLAGVMDATAFLPDDAPAQWSAYVGVADADAALARVVHLGGSVVAPAEDTPYGRLAAAADPTGARFKLVAPNAAMPERTGTAPA